MREKLFIDMHVIQTLPPSNINRDDTGSPKTAQYGGTTRSRVSSQSWKKAMRDYFNEFGDIKNVGIRSLKIPSYIANLIMEKDESIEKEEALKLANKVLNNAGIKTKNDKNTALLFIGSDQAEALAKAAIENNEDKKELKKILNENTPIDIALFGRMVADDPSLNEDASCQVAHAISTHKVQTEFDFFTATDDLVDEDNAGAGMLGTVEFNSSTLYRYANIALHELKEQLGNKENVINATKLFTEAFINSMPTGKINTFANQSLPQGVIITIRKDRPVNLVTAFEEPVNTYNGYVKNSIEKLENEFNKVEKFVEEPVATYTIGFENLGEEKENIRILIEDLSEEIDKILE